MPPYQLIIDKYYPAGSRLRDIYMRHCRSVTDKALAIARRLRLPLKEEEIETAGMLHDIGVVRCDAPGIECRGTSPYICHGIEGAAMLRDEAVDEKYAQVCLRHTGAGISAEEIEHQKLPLPPGDYMPRTLLEQLICYADKFFSKSGDMTEKPVEVVRAQLARHSQESAERFDRMHAMFGGES